VELVDARHVSEKVKLLPAEKRAMKHELSGKEPIEKIVVLRNSRKKLGRFTTHQVKEILNDIGFNVDAILSKSYFSDIEAVMNVNGFLIPGWSKFVRFTTKLFKLSEKMFLVKLAPGKERLHVRLFESNDGSWLITAHTDYNWMNLNLLKVFKSHARGGAGNYTTGTLMMYELIRRFGRYVEKNKVFPYSEIEKVTRWAYYQALADKFKSALKLSPVLM
jgi:hypothetical protein